jgi:hypothetical protein
MSSTEIHMAITRAAKNIADTMDEQILAFFGSEEQAKAYAHLFVVEQWPVQFSTSPAESGNYLTYHADVEFRIRPKTLAELEAEKNEQ